MQRFSSINVLGAHPPAPPEDPELAWKEKQRRLAEARARRLAAKNGPSPSVSPAPECALSTPELRAFLLRERENPQAELRALLVASLTQKRVRAIDIARRFNVNKGTVSRFKEGVSSFPAED